MASPFNESHFPSAVSPELLSCCPAVDLSATVSEDDDAVYIRRQNGELVFRHSERNLKVQAVRWKPDGQTLAIGWSDGLVRLVGLENTKAFHHLRVSDGTSGALTYIGWSQSPVVRNSRHAVLRNESVRQGLFSDWLVDDDSAAAPDLLEDLTSLDVETVVSRLKPLPVSGGSGEDMFVFSTTKSVDFIFQPTGPEDHNLVDVMLVGRGDGTIHLSVCDTLIIGTFKIGGAGDTRALYLVPMDVKFVQSFPVNLSLLSSKMARLQKFLRYLKQAQAHMGAEYQSTRELPNRFLQTLQESLNKQHPKEPNSIVYALYHAVMTGCPPAPVTEWLLETLAERGHKRWDKAVMSGMKNLRELVHLNMLPALERCNVVLSRLLGVAKFHDGRADIGFTSAQISRLMDVMTCMFLVTNKIILVIMDEQAHFVAFSSWLRLEIKKQASASAGHPDDVAEKRGSLDVPKVLTYIEQYLVESPLSIFFDKPEQDDWAKDWAAVGPEPPSLVDTLDAQLRSYDDSEPHMKALPTLDFLVTYLSDRAAAVMASIADILKHGVGFGGPVELSIGVPIDKYDICTAAKSATQGRTFTAMVSKTSNKVHLFRSDIATINGISSPASTSALGLCLEGGDVVDVKFLSDKILLALWIVSGSQARLLAIPVQSPALTYVGYKGDGNGGPNIPTQSIEHESVTATFWSADVSAGTGFIPASMEVVGLNSSRGDIPARVCLLGKDKTTYKVFALPPERGMVRRGS